MSFRKQHLMFMPENDGSNLELTSSLEIKDKHEIDFCKMCQSRTKSWFVNVQSPDVQKSILKKQRDTSKVWNETMDNIWKGNVSGNKIESNVTNIICVDDTESDIEEVSSPVVLPTLSPIINIQSKVPSPSNNPNSTQKLKQNLDTTPISKEISSKHNTLHPRNLSDDHLLSLFETLRGATFSTAVRNSLIYSYQARTGDHVHWIRRSAKTRCIKVARLELTTLKTKISELKKANIDNEEEYLALQQSLENKEIKFARRFIERVNLEHYHGKYKSLDERSREEIRRHRNDLKCLVEMSEDQRTALKKIRSITSQWKVLKHTHNKFTPLIMNELFYQEQKYKEKYIKLTHQSDQNECNINKESLFVGSKKTKKPLRKKLREKRQKQKAHLLRQVSQSVLSKHDNGETSKTPSENIYLNENSANFHKNNNFQNTDSSCHTRAPTSSPGSTQQFVPTPKKVNQATSSFETTLTPTGPFKRNKFRPYKRLLAFS